MRLQLIFVSILISFHALASEDKSIKDLFEKYDSVMNAKKTEIIEDVFTRKFIQESGGKDALIKKIKSAPSSSSRPQITWKKGQKGNIYLARMKKTSIDKKKSTSHETEFILEKEDNKFKIGGTLSDPD